MTRWRRIFFTARGTWRVPWRLLFTGLTWALLTLLLSVALATTWALQGRPLWPQTAAPALDQGALLWLALIATLSTLLTLWIARRGWEPGTWADWGLVWRSRRAWLDLVVGGTVALLAQAVLAAALALTGSARWHIPSSFALLSWGLGSLQAAVVFALVAWYEEVLFRGYLYATLAQGMSRRGAMLLSALAFAALHGSNPDFGVRALVGLTLAGCFFVWARETTPWGLALPVGFHWGWNFAEGVVFGFPVSGLRVFRWSEARLSGPVWWTGGAFGPEAGAVLLLALATAYGGVRVWRRWQERMA